MHNLYILILIAIVILTTLASLYIINKRYMKNKLEPASKSLRSNSDVKELKAGSPEFEEIYNKPGILAKLLGSTQRQNVVASINQPQMSFAKATRNSREPMIIVPGLGGTQLVSAHTNWGQMNECNFLEHIDGTTWVSVNPPPGGDCQLQLLKNIYNPTSKTLNTNSNTNISVNGKVGSLSSCKCLNDDLDCLFGESNYMKNLFSSLEAVGYKEGVDLFAVGYDFRLQPQGNILDTNTYNNPGNYYGLFFLQLKSVIETAVTQTKQKVTLLGHSMGCFMTNLFINLCRMHETTGYLQTGWVDAHIGRFIAVAPAFEGGPKALRTVLCGDNPGTPLGSSSAWQAVERTLSGPISMIPLLDIGYNNNVAISVKNEGAVNCYNIASFLSQSGEPALANASQVYEGFITGKLMAYQDPNLPVNLVYGNGLDTEYGNYTFQRVNGKIDFSKPLSMDVSKGDATVPLSCLRLPLTGASVLVNGQTKVIAPWKNVTEFTVGDKSGEHLDIIKSSKNVIKYITDLVSH